MSKSIYVGNLSFDATEDDLRAMFAAHGTVTRVHVTTDRETGRPRGFGFIEMSEGGEAAIAALDGTQQGGRTLKVNESRPRGDRPGSAGGRTYGTSGGRSFRTDD